MRGNCSMGWIRKAVDSDCSAWSSSSMRPPLLTRASARPSEHPLLSCAADSVSASHPTRNARWRNRRNIAALLLIVCIGAALFVSSSSEPVAADAPQLGDDTPANVPSVLPEAPRWVTIADGGRVINVGYAQSAMTSTVPGNGPNTPPRKLPLPVDQPDGFGERLKFLTVVSTPEGVRVLRFVAIGKGYYSAKVWAGQDLLGKTELSMRTKDESDDGPLLAEVATDWSEASAWAVGGPMGPWYRVSDKRQGRPVAELSVWEKEGGSTNVDPKTRSIPGINNVGGCAIHPSGEWLLVTHLVPKSDLPSTQTDQGWVFTNAVSIVRPGKADEPVSVQTLPLDLRTEAFANPGAVTFSPDGARAYVAHVGADVVSVLSVPKLLEAAKSLPVAAEASSSRRLDPRLTRKYVTARIAVGAGPTALALSPDGKSLAVANRWEPTVSVIDTESLEVVETRGVGERLDTAAARGERLFHSGRLSLGGQFSCASCHPNGDQDGLNWDLPGDGDPTFLNTKSLLWLTETAPYGWRGTSAALEERIKGTLTHLFGYAVTEAEATDIAAYLDTIGRQQAARDQSRRDELAGAFAKSLAEGRRLFETAGCARCHAGGKLTDGQPHTLDANGEAGTFDTPTLLGLRQTAPYWHDGRAKTIAEIFTTVDPRGPHGVLRDWDESRRSSLEVYLISL